MFELNFDYECYFLGRWSREWGGEFVDVFGVMIGIKDVCDFLFNFGRLFFFFVVLLGFFFMVIINIFKII